MRKIPALAHFAHELRVDMHALYLAARDPRTPWYAKTVALLVAAYAFSPIDLIPDFVPVLGLIDDAVILPAGLWLARRLVPPELLREHRAAAERASRRPVSRTGVAIVALLWLGLIAMVAGAIWSYRYY